MFVAQDKNGSVKQSRTQTMRFRVKPALEDHLKALALKENVGVSELLRRISVEYCQRHPLKGEQ
jgi:hypothetical protein